MTKEQILFPEEVSAYRIGNESKVTIVARGNDDGLCKIHITSSAIQIYPPIYMVVGEPCAVIGSFPYTVDITIPYSTDLDYIQVQLSDGTKRIPVYDVMDKQENLPEALAKLSDTQAVGYAYNSSDINIAIQDAINKLKQRFIGSSVSAVVKESGFVTIGFPGAISYFYVLMELHG